MKILLVGNYLPDRQHSMLRFASMLEQGLTARGHEVRIFQPAAKIGASSGLPSVLTKWLRYVDKYLLFPAALKREVEWADVVHICDHSNSVYAAHISKPLLVTCHDLLAVRGALGEATFCPASASGAMLQKWILESITKCGIIACDSEATRGDVKRLTGKSEDRLPIIHIAVDSPYREIDPATADRTLDAAQVPSSRPFLLMVGSAEPRKNREGALRVFARVVEELDCNFVIAGGALTPQLREMAGKLGVTQRVIELTNASDATILALYNKAFALLFPSHCEGFGMPVIEAQACGCPVIASDIAPIPEVAGDAAFLHRIDDESGMANSVLLLRSDATRADYRERGLRNARRFSMTSMCEQYEKLYTAITNSPELSMQRG